MPPQSSPKIEKKEIKGVKSITVHFSPLKINTAFVTKCYGKNYLLAFNFFSLFFFPLLGITMLL